MIYFIAGHNLKDPGAVATQSIGKITESELTIELRDLIIHYMKEIENFDNIRKDKDDQSLREIINSLNKNVNTQDLIVDIHFNAFNGKASGTEVIIPKIYSKKEKELGEIITRELADIMGIPNRGVKDESKTARGRIGILKGKGYRILLEICFMDNPKDFTFYSMNKYIVAAKIAEEIHKYYVENIQ